MMFEEWIEENYPPPEPPAMPYWLAVVLYLVWCAFLGVTEVANVVGVIAGGWEDVGWFVLKTACVVVGWLFTEALFDQARRAWARWERDMWAWSERVNQLAIRCYIDGLYRRRERRPG